MARPYKDRVCYDYMIQSVCFSDRYYVGFTEDLRKRLAAHNAGKNKSTAASKPWKLIGYIAFEEKRRALAFEAYLKTALGRAFTKKRLWRSEKN